MGVLPCSASTDLNACSPGQKGSSLSIWDNAYVCYSDNTWP